MILKSMNIKNFRSYYGDNTFEFSQGLTLIIGDNGDGKTTFFEALEWLFDTATENKSATNISEKRKSEMEVGDIDEVVAKTKDKKEAYQLATDRIMAKITELQTWFQQGCIGEIP